MSDGFEAFARAELPRLARYAVMLSGDRELAQDLVQDVHCGWTLVLLNALPDGHSVEIDTFATPLLTLAQLHQVADGLILHR